MENQKIAELTEDAVKQEAIEILLQMNDAEKIETITNALKLQQMLDNAGKRSAWEPGTTEKKNNIEKGDYKNDI